MPALPSDADLKPPTYTEATAEMEGADILPEDAYNGNFFSAEELASLSGAPMWVIIPLQP